MEQACVARVIAVHKERYQLSSQVHGEFFARLKSSHYYQSATELFPTAGDLVQYHFNDQGDSQILHTLQRKTFFQRFIHRKSQAIAANFDTVLILTSANHDFNPKRLHRYLALARESQAAYAIVITKMDLADQPKFYLQRAREAAGNCPIHCISAVTEQGLNEVRAYLQPDSVTVFLGSSGVGKSTLVNSLAGHKIMDVNGIRESDSKGRHTTTHRQMIQLENGAWILDTPGMRELGLMEAENGVAQTFIDIDELANQCRFRDCKHQNEPGCAIREALEDGRIDVRQVEEYLMLQREARRKRPQSPEEKMQKTKKMKQISKFSREHRKERIKF